MVNIKINGTFIDVEGNSDPRLLVLSHNSEIASKKV